MFWEELTVEAFAASLEKTKGVCVFPIGCLEKHGHHLPLGTDIYIAREITARAAKSEEVMIFPEYPLGIVAEVKHKAGTIALSSQLQFTVLEAIFDEIARNGYKKILIGNGHGGNENFLRYFAQAMLEKEKDYTVYVYDLYRLTPEQEKALCEKYGPPAPGGHADVIESSDMLAIRPDLVHMELADAAEAVYLGRAAWYENAGVFTGINWYASFPHQAAGDPSLATGAYGEDILNYNAENLIAVLKKLKEDDTLPQLFSEFYSSHAHPGT